MRQNEIAAALASDQSVAMAGEDKPAGQRYRPLVLSTPKRSNVELFADRAAICHDAAQAGYGR